VKLPKDVRTYCSHCGKHMVHRLSVVSVSHKRRRLSKGERDKFRRDRGHGGHGRYSKVPVSAMGMKSKTTTKVQVKLTCDVCGKSSVRLMGRMKKPEVK
jgi:ribosomal protein L44E